MCKRKHLQMFTEELFEIAKNEKKKPQAIKI